MRIDAGGLHLGARPIEVRPDGWRVYRGRIPADVVMSYPDLHPPRDEFIPADEALSEEALASMRGSPFSILHADDLLDATTVREHAVGTVLAATANWESDPPEMVVDVIIHDADAQAEVESGRLAQISPGYRSEEDWTPGEHKGRRYQVVQRRRRYNHLAAVPSARTVTADGRPARLDKLPEAADGAAYSPTTDARTETMDETETQHGSETDTDTHAGSSNAGQHGKPSKPRADAVVLSPEDIEVLKKMSPEGFMVVSTALGLTAAAMPEPDGDEVVAEVEPAADVDGTDPAMAVDAVGGGKVADPAIADLMARLARLEAAQAAGGGDAAAMPMDASDMGGKGKPPPFGKKDGKTARATDATAMAMAVTVDASAALAAADAQRTVAEKAARATFDASAKFVGVVRKDGHEAYTPTEAAAIMVGLIGKHLPLLEDTAKELVRGQRLDALVPLYRQAEQVRRDALIQSQADGIAECLRADGDAGPDVLPYRAPKARGA